MREQPPVPSAVEQMTELVFGADRRVRDRRNRPTPFMSRFTFVGGNRARGRRAGEDTAIFVDLYGQTLFLVGTLILLLNMLDAWFTIMLLGIGGEEVNPVANLMLNSGTGTFLFVKTAGIGVCTAVLIMIKNFRGAKLGLGIVVCAYSVLLVWHFYLASQTDMVF